MARTPLRARSAGCSLRLVRGDGSTVRVYRTRNNVVEQLAAFPAANAAGQSHTYRVLNDPARGKLTVWRDEVLLGTSTDPAQLTLR